MNYMMVKTRQGIEIGRGFPRPAAEYYFHRKGRRIDVRDDSCHSSP